MLSLVLQSPGHAYTQNKIQSSGSAVSGGGHEYVLEEYNSNKSFNNSLTPWAFVYNDDVVENPTSTAEVSYSEAYTGLSSASLSFASAVEWFAINISGATDSGADISSHTLQLSAYIKTSSSQLRFIVFVPTLVNQTAAIASTSGLWARRTFDVALPALSDQAKIYVGIYSADGTGSAFVDEFSITAVGNYTDVIDYTYITFSPAWTYAALAGSSTPERFICVFTSGSNVNIGSPIQNVVAAGNIITRINLFDPLPNVPAAGNTITVLSENNRYNSGRTFSITRGITDASVSTSIESGYSSASISVLTGEIVAKTGSFDLALWRAMVYDENGELFDGVVTAVGESDGVCELTISGFSYFLDKTPYVGQFESDSSVTIRLVLDDILSTTLLISGDGSVIDRDDAISTIQSAAGGIGPLDFTKENNTMKSSIDHVLSLGTFDDTYDMLFLQIYSGRKPVLRRVRRRPAINYVEYIVNGHNVVGRKTEWSTDVSEFSSVMSGTYSNASGGQAQTAGVFNLDLVSKYGILEDDLSAGNLSEGEIYLVMQNSVHSIKNSGSIGGLSLIGKILSGVSGIRVPVSQVRAGDVILLTDVLNVASGSNVSNANGDVVIVGSTKYDCTSGKMEITPYEFESTVESMLNVLTIG
jgi:hypothetical protein